MAEKTTDSYLTMRLEGPAIRPGRMKLDDFVAIAHEFSSAVKRVAQVLMNRQSLTGGGWPTELLEGLSLDLVGFTHGSPAVVASFERTPPKTGSVNLFPDIDPGDQAYTALVQGFDPLLHSTDILPAGFDLGVLLKIRDLGKSLEKGISRIEFKLNHRPQLVRGEITSKVYQRVRERIARPEAQQISIEGRLLMADFKESQRRLRIHPAIGIPVDCRFEEELTDTVEECLRKQVRATGRANYNEQGMLVGIDLRDVDPIEPPAIQPDLILESEPATPWAYNFWENLSAQEYAQRQGVGPVNDVTKLYGEGAVEDWEGFDAAVEQWRTEKPAN